MDVYVYQAAFLCGDCGEDTRRENGERGQAPENPEDEWSYDSDEYPKGPYADGGGEADTPQHCDHCGLFLENPLTTDGVRYVREALELGGDADVLATWRAFYTDVLADA